MAAAAFQAALPVARLPTYFADTTLACRRSKADPAAKAAGLW